jgi:hypothetical protein
VNQAIINNGIPPKPSTAGLKRGTPEFNKATRALTRWKEQYVPGYKERKLKWNRSYFLKWYPNKRKDAEWLKKVREADKVYFSKNEKELTEKREKRRLHLQATDADWRFNRACKTLMYKLFDKDGIKKSKRSVELYGCTKQDLIYHIKSQLKPEWSWENRKGVWDIDHIIPYQFFRDNDLPVDLAWHYTNLQPLDAVVNRTIKRDTIVKPLVEKVVAHPDTPDELRDIALALLSY